MAVTSQVITTNGQQTQPILKIIAVREAVLRESFLRRGEYLDQTRWSIVRDDWRQAKAVWGSIVH